MTSRSPVLFKQAVGKGMRWYWGGFFEPWRASGPPPDEGRPSDVPHHPPPPAPDACSFARRSALRPAVQRPARTRATR